MIVQGLDNFAPPLNMSVNNQVRASKVELMLLRQPTYSTVWQAIG